MLNTHSNDEIEIARILASRSLLRGIVINHNGRRMSAAAAVDAGIWRGGAPVAAVAAPPPPKQTTLPIGPPRGLTTPSACESDDGGSQRTAIVEREPSSPLTARHGDRVLHADTLTPEERARRDALVRDKRGGGDMRVLLQARHHRRGGGAWKLVPSMLASQKYEVLNVEDVFDLPAFEKAIDATVERLSPYFGRYFAQVLPNVDEVFFYTNTLLVRESVTATDDSFGDAAKRSSAFDIMIQVCVEASTENGRTSPREDKRLYFRGTAICRSIETLIVSMRWWDYRTRRPPDH